jgi:hypothetical protein
MEEKRAKLGFEIKPSLKKKLKQRAVEMGRPMYALTEEAIERYLDGEKEREPDDRDIAKVRYILEHGQEHHENGFRTQIVAYYKDVVANPRSGAKGRKRAG